MKPDAPAPIRRPRSSRRPHRLAHALALSLAILSLFAPFVPRSRAGHGAVAGSSVVVVQSGGTPAQDSSSRPAPDSAPRPAVDVATLDIPAFIREVAASERANNRNFADYTYTSKTTERETKNGRVVEEHVTVAEVYPQYGEAVRKTLSRDGVQLSAEESEREFKRAVEGFKKGEQEAAKRRAEAAKQGAESAGRQSAPPPAPDPKAIPHFGPNWGFGYRSGFSSGSFQLSLSNFLQAAEFHTPRRETFRGRDTLVLDFRPRADFAPPADAQKPYAKLTGRVYIDLADRQIARLEAWPMPGAAPKGRAVAASAANPSVVVEQTHLPDGRWKESLIRFNSAADKELFNGVERDFTEEMYDFRRFTATGEEKVDAPKPPPGE